MGGGEQEKKKGGSVKCACKSPYIKPNQSKKKWGDGIVVVFHVGGRGHEKRSEGGW